MSESRWMWVNGTMYDLRNFLSEYIPQFEQLINEAQIESRLPKFKHEKLDWVYAIIERTYQGEYKRHVILHDFLYGIANEIIINKVTADAKIQKQ